MEKEPGDTTARPEPVVLSGISCRLPESGNMQEFRDNLMNNVDMITADDRRWKPGALGLPKRNGKLKDLSKFDATLFGVHPKQASYMDPQLRILLELTHEAIIDAGVNPETLRGSNTGVFIGAQASESQTIWNHKGGDHIGFVLTGSALSMLSNRISFCFDFNGPSFTIDTACSSGLYAMNQAIQNIRNGACDAAIVGGTCLCLRPDVSDQFQKLGMLSPEGMCRTFDKDGVGYCRSEGISVVFIQKQKDARRVYCTLVHSRVNSDGNKIHGITFPSGAVQKKLLEETYAEAGISPSDVTYVEAHGTGTPAGDPQECYAIDEVFCRDRQGPLLIGSVKSNMGHCESASGIASMAKIVIALEENVIPANLHFREPNEYITGIKEGRLEVVTQNRPWSGGLVGVNSFGFGGANAHLIVKSNDKEKTQHESADKPRLFVYGGRTHEAMEHVLQMAQKYSTDLDLHALWNESANMSIDTHPFRGFTVLNTGNEIVDVQKSSEKDRPVWFIFSGMGSQWPGMGRAMMEVEVFRNSIMKCDAILKQHGVRLYDLLMSEDEDLMKDVVTSFVCITSIQVALVDMLKCMDIEPDGIVGHSVGELGCAYADGSLTAEEAVLAAYWRGHCVKNANLPAGGMAATGLTWEEALAQCPPGIVPACHNSEESVTVSGPVEDVRQFVEELKEKRIFAREVQSAGVAFHSYFMKDVAPALQSALEKVITAKPRSEKWISSSFPEPEWSTETAKLSSADYHVHNLVSPVLFHEAVSHVPSNAVVIEIAPHCLLQSILKGSLGAKCCIVGLMKRKNPDNVDFCFTALGKCYQNSMNLDPLKLFPPVEFPVPRGTPMISPHVQLDHSHTWEVAKVGTGNNRETSFEIDLTKNSDYRHWMDHKIDGRPVLPAAAALVLTWRALAIKEDKEWDRMPVLFEDVTLYRAAILNPDAKRNIDVKFLHGGDNFQVIERDDVIMSGRVTVPDAKAISTYLDKHSEKAETIEIPSDLNTADLYKNFRLKGFEYGPPFQLLMAGNLDGTRGVIKWTGDWVTFLDAMLHLPILHTQNLILPTRITAVAIDPELHDKHMQTFEDEVQGVEINFQTDTNSRISPGVHFYDVSGTLAQRTEQKPATHESVHFIPYRRSLSMADHDELLVKYAEKCEAAATEEFRKSMNNGFSESPYFSEKLRGSGQTNNMKNINALKELETDPDKTRSYLGALLEMNKIDRDDKYGDYNIDIINTKSEELSHDKLLSNLLQAKYLKPALDIWVENMLNPNPKVVEICTGQQSDSIINWIKSNFFLKPSFCVAKTLGNNAGNETNEDSEDIVPWELDQDAPERLQNAQLVIANNIIRKHKNVMNALTGISQILNEDGFILLHEVTTNFAVAAPIDGLYSDQVKEIADLDDRSCSIYCDRAKWLKIFEEEGLQVVYEVTDNLLSSLFLLRKKVKNVVENQIMLGINDPECNWVDELKSKVDEVSQRGKGENLWLRADGSRSGILGLVNCLVRENGDKIRCIFNMDGNATDLNSDVIKKLIDSDMAKNVYKNGEWGCYRHLPLAPVENIQSENAFVSIRKRGDLSSLSWMKTAPSRTRVFKTQRTELCDVTYASLNFRDVMLATGKLPPDAIPGHFLEKLDSLLGMEFSGRDSQGTSVMGLCPAKGLATSVETLKQLLWPVPDHWTLEQAATVPSVYTTVFYSLVVRGQIKAGNSILIHSGSGGVGQAAISVALHYGCKVFTTVGTPEKKDFLQEKFPELDDSCFFSSRDTTFELGIKRATSGKGVDLVLNSLAEDKLQASVRVLAAHGKFLEIGKYDLAKNTPLGMSAFLKNITFHGILLDSLFDAENSDLQVVSRCMTEGIKSGVVQPLTSTVFEKEAIEDAFRFMASGKHIGKVLIKVRDDSEPVSVSAIPRTICDPDKTYIITGGLGGFGLELSHWLVKRGARSLVLSSRSGIKTGYQTKKLDYFREQGVDVVVSTKKITDKEEVVELLQAADGKPVGGVFHLAAVLNDALLENQSQESFLKVMEPKVKGTINLDHVTRERCKESLDWFVVFSSTTCGYGNAGQTNYGYANSVMERIVEQRRKDGYPGLAIQWGTIGDIGLFIDGMGDNSMVLNGLIPQRLTSCLKSLDVFFNQSESIVTSYVIADIENTIITGENIVDAVCNILGIKSVESIDENKPFADMGLDSLLAVEVKVTLENQFNIVLAPKEIREMTLKKLKSLAKGEKNQSEEAEDEDEEGEINIAALLNLDVDNIELMPKEIIKKLNDVEEGIPLFAIHDVFGTVLTLTHVISQVKVPVYGLQRTRDVPLDSVIAIAKSYLKEIRNIRKGQPFHLVGYSFGACIAQEMTLQLQDSQSEELKSLTLLDGSHTWVSTLMDSINTHKDHPEIQAVNYVFGGMGLDILDINNISEDKLEKLAKHLLTLKPGADLEEAKIAAMTTYNSIQIVCNHSLTGQYHGDVTLIKAESSTRLPGLTPDYGLGEYCTGKLIVESIPGRHVSYLMDSSGDQVASMLNNIVLPSH